MGPEEPSFVEENVETEVSGERDQAEDEGDQEENTLTNQRVTRNHKLKGTIFFQEYC